MTHTYSVTGMTCTACEAKVKSALLSTPHVVAVDVSHKDNSAVIEMDQHIPIIELQKALTATSTAYQITAAHHSELTEQTKSWFSTFKPVLLIFAFILFVTLTVELQEGFLWMRWMSNFMAGFFLTFSFFKLLNLEAFADSYSMYDVIAIRWNAWGYIYAFIELTLGILFLTGYQPILTNALAFVIMSVSIIGVLQSVFSKQKIKCACLGAVFNLPMSTITVIEDAAMIIMSGTMLVILL